MGLFDFFKKNSSGDQSGAVLSKEERYGKASLRGYKTQDWKEALVEFQKLENEGFGEASIALGQFAQIDNTPKALAHFRKAADAGLAEGAWGCAAIIGHSYIPDFEGKDKEWYQYCLQAALGGCCDAMHELGKAYSHQNNYLSAFYWFTMSGYYEHGDGHYDASQIIKIWEAAGKPVVDTSRWNPKEEREDGASTLSQNALSIWKIYTGETKLNQQIVDSMFTLQAMPGSEIVGLFLGHFFEDHLKMDANSKMAYQVAANSGSIAGMKCLGDMQAYGKGCEKDLNKALSWYKGAAEACEKVSCFIMGEFSRQNPNLAAYWYSVSFRRGFEQALERVKKL